eukprot:g9230.t1
MACPSETRAWAASHGTAKRARISRYNTAETGLDHSTDEVMSDEEHKGSHPRRWSPEEDERLRASVERHQGTNWKEIAKEVMSRNHVQCLQRWKKVLTPGLVKGQWTNEEDELLVSVVNEGHKNWGSLSARIPGRTSKQCRERWCHHLDPRIVKGQWTAAEDEIIVSMQKRIGNKWAQIAQHLDGRTENATKIRWKILERDMKRQGDEREKDKPPRGSSSRQGADARLRCLAAQAAASVLSKTGSPEGPIGVPRDPVVAHHDHGESSDDSVGLPKPLPPPVHKGKRRASSTGNLHGGQGGHGQQQPHSGSAVGPAKGAGSKGNSVQDRHGCGRRGWLAEEDQRLKDAVDEYGEKNWREVARKVRTRNHIQCQQRWKKALRPGLVKGAWNVEEDEKLVSLIGQGFSSWSQLASNTGRTAKQCRERWMHHLDPSLRHESWTPEEDQLLMKLEARLGKRWAAIARDIPGRTEHAVKGRFKTLSRERDLDRQAGSGSQARRAAGKGSTDRQRASSKEPGGYETPVQSSLGKGRGVARIVSGKGVGSTKPSRAPSGSGNGATGSAAAEARGSFTRGGLGSGAGTGAGEFMEQAMRQPQHPQVRRPQQQRVVSTQEMLDLDLGAQHASQHPMMTPPAAPSAPSAAMSVSAMPAAMSGGAMSAAGMTGAAMSGAAISGVPMSGAPMSGAPMSGAMGAGAVGAVAAAASNATGEASTARLFSVSGARADTSLSRLLSVSSVKTDPSLGDVTSGYCGRGQGSGRTATKSTSNTSMISDISSLGRKQSVGEPNLPVAELGIGWSRPVQPVHKATPRVFDGSISEPVVEGSSLVNRIDYSDLASILMDGGFDACKDGVESESEAATLGEDPYSDYSLSADDHIIMGYHPMNFKFSRPPQESGPPQQKMQEQQHVSFRGLPLEDMVGSSSDLSDILPASVFEGGAADDPSDPYYF